MADMETKIASFIASLITEVETALSLSGDVKYGRKGGGTQLSLPHVRIVPERHVNDAFALNNIEEWELHYIIVVSHIDISQALFSLLVWAASKA